MKQVMFLLQKHCVLPFYERYLHNTTRTLDFTVVEWHDGANSYYNISLRL